MKKIMFLLVAMLTITAMGVKAQNGPPRQQMPVEDRVKRTVGRMTPELGLSEAQVKDITPVYTTFYTDMDKLREAGQPNPEDRQKITTARDEKLQKILTEEQMKKLKELEEQMRQRRPQ